jgi:DTW domain-containing protein YfiP
MPRIETRTRLSLVIHRFEDRKPTNTGRLATRCLVNSEVLVRGELAQPPVAWSPAPQTQALLLFPHNDAQPLNELELGPLPVTLVVPDGNWRQAAKVRARMPGLSSVRCVSLPVGQPTRYRLRAASHEDGLATIEAIARAYGVLEGPEVQEALEEVFLAMVERTLWWRGLLAKAHVSCGIPDGALQQNSRHGLPPA